MPDLRFFRRAGPFKISEIAAHLGADVLEADRGSIPIHDIGDLDSAEAGEISVFTDARYLDGLGRTRAEVVICSRELARHAAVSTLLMFRQRSAPGLCPGRGTSFIRTLPWKLGLTPVPAWIRPPRSDKARRSTRGVVIGRGVEIGRRCHIGPNAVLGEGVRLGDDTKIGANTTISHALIGHRVEIETGRDDRVARLRLCAGAERADADASTRPRRHRGRCSDRSQLRHRPWGNERYDDRRGYRSR